MITYEDFESLTKKHIPHNASVVLGFSGGVDSCVLVTLFDNFVNSFEATDTRTSRIITEWQSTATGELVMGLGNDQSHPYKLPFDPNAVGASAGNDIIVIRYADILLTRAEALNELNGPTQEAIDLINEVRNRAGATPLNLGSFGKDCPGEIWQRLLTNVRNRNESKSVCCLP